MNLDQLNDLELDNIGSWPKPFQFVVVAILCAVIGYFGYSMVLSDSWQSLESAKESEVKLRKDFSTKARMAAQLPVLKVQMQEMESIFVDLIAQLPSKHEIPGLLDELSFVGADNGLEFKKINWEPEIEHEFSVELPIRIKLSGTYHQLGRFASDVAALPRIIILKNFSLSKADKSGGEMLNMDLLVTTYRYKEKGTKKKGGKK